MPVIAIVNRKGGSGKSTLSTNIAVAWARAGKNVMLGDVDRQQSIRSWLRRRGPAEMPISTWVVDQGKMLRPPPGTSHVVLDTPGALYGLDLAKVLIRLDALVVPVGPSVFDRDASLDFLAELNRLPRVASGKCKVAVVGMRWPHERTKHWHETRTWDVPLVTVLPDSVNYRTCLEQGRTLFDQVDVMSHPDMQYWRPLLLWLDGVGVSRDRMQAARTSDASSAPVEPAADVPAYLRRDAVQDTPAATKWLVPQPQPVPDPVQEGSPYTSLPLQAAPAEPSPTAGQPDAEPSDEAIEALHLEQKDSKGFWASRWQRMFG